MRFEKVSAHAFGRLHERELDLSPGLNLIWGANEAGKSTWHDALYAGLCGMRRGKGRMKKEDEAFAERRRPWDRDEWRVGVRIALSDGRTVEIRQDLDGRIDCKAVDATLGHDLSAEIMHEGTPDGSRWLGLDRRSFLATACVRQADLLRVREDDSAGYLQTFLQQAAASAGSDETVARALERIDTFRKTQVGRRVAHSTRPLQATLRREEKAQAALEQARDEHREFLALTVQAEEARAAADSAARDLSRARTAQARQSADALAERVARARALAERFADGPPAESIPESDLPGATTAVLRAWENRPRNLSELAGPGAAELRLEIESLPDTPDGDAEPNPSVVTAHRDWQDSRRNLEVHVGATADGGSGPDAHLDRTTALINEADRMRDAARSLLAAGAVALAIAALLLAATWTGPIFWVVLAAAAALGAGGFLRMRDARVARLRASVWQQKRMQLERAVTAAAGALTAALPERSAGTTDDIEAAHAAYVESCGVRRDQAARAASRLRLEQQLEDRERAERAAEDERERLVSVRANLHRTADACGIPAGEDEARVAGLSAWMEDNDARRHQRETELQEWTELEQLLDGATLEDLENDLRRDEDEAIRLAAEAGDDEPATIDDTLDMREEIRRLQENTDSTAREANRLLGMAQDRAGRLESVAEAEEELDAAVGERQRLESLDRILERTRRYLEDAQERVHRDIAPVLAGTLADWLPAVTAGRYREALVDPESLEVRLRDGDGEWRKATGLSHGTTELVYLLLRLSLARHLTVPGEICPLLLDDVTVQCDAERTRLALEVLHGVSRERQVILFSQEEEVLRWARENLQEPADTLVELESPGSETITDGPDPLRT